ncbi:MAG TPA: PEP-CTERM sorting domain-containing protein [Acidobacteriaceae bacterium]
MRIRPSFRFLFLLSALVVPAAAHADTFTFVPDSGDPTLAFSIPDSTTPSFFVSDSYAHYDTLTATNGDPLIVVFWSDAVATARENNGFGGHLDTEIVDEASGLSYLLDGPTLYTGDESSPAFIVGTYYLMTDPFGPNNNLVGGTLTITAGDSAAPTPEPSSYVLFGTGLLGAFGAIRRRFRKA